MKATTSPKILKWARVSLHLEKESVLAYFAQKSKQRFKVDASVFDILESSEQEINLSLLREFANFYKRPLAIFFLENPPVELPLPKDHRTINSEVNQKLSPATILVSRRARYIQDILKELSDELNFPLAFPIKHIKLSDDPGKKASEFRKILNFSTDLQIKKIKDQRDLFNVIREKLEEINVFTLKATFPLEDVRAFSFVDKDPRLIVINNRDGGYFGYAPKAFSLLHEFAHILLDEGSLCNDYDFNRRSVEIFCNQFAASFLVPDEDFLSHLQDISKGNFNQNEIDDCLSNLRSVFKVSQDVLLRKFLTLNLIDNHFYKEKINVWAEEYEKTKDKKRFIPHPTPAQRAFNNNGRKFTELVLYAKGSGKISLDRAADYLGVNFKWLSDIESRTLKNS